MVVIRNRISSLASGGPRQFAEIRDRVLVKAESGRQNAAASELQNIGFRPRRLQNAPVVIAEPENLIEDVIENVRTEGRQVREAVSEVQEAREREESFVDSTIATLSATQQVIQAVRDFDPVVSADFAHSFADFGPENLRLAPDEMRTLAQPEEERQTLQEIVTRLNAPRAWEVTRGENAAVVIFDTGYAEDLISSSRVQGTFHSEDVDSAFAPAEGHGTMCAGGAAANSSEGVPFDGFAPEADVYLVRITGPDGQIRSDIISRGWDWVLNLDTSKPLVTNHSYGTPVCSTVRRTQFCNDALSEVIRIANSDPGITSCYAAGNEAMFCGHRLSGLTNGITAHNSLQDIITVGALLSNGRDAQRYSSHGRGDCSPRADPKPNVSCRIPMRTYYGTEGGWEIKDMSTGVFGSGGGTSHASPNICGMIALVQSAAVSGDLPEQAAEVAQQVADGGSRRGEALQTEEIKQIIRDHSTPPRPTQVNSFGVFVGPEGWDARFGFGQFNVDEALTGG